MPSLATALRFIRDVRAEANRITWPSGQDTRRLTLMVFILVTLVALFLVGVDMLIAAGMTTLFGLHF